MNLNFWQYSPICLYYNQHSTYICSYINTEIITMRIFNKDQ